jgi:HEAT repeat protein
VDALAKLIDNSDVEIGRAAAASLGMIGGEQATRVLQAALKQTQSPVFPVAARAMLLCAEGAIAADRARGLQLYQELSADTMPKPVRLTAMRVLNAAGPAPEYTNRWPAPTGEAARQDKSGFLGRNP